MNETILLICAETRIAAENLEASSGIESRTLASRMYYWDKGEQLLTSKDILVVDEAGMIGSRQMERILSEAQKHNTKVVLIGDPQQLQAIEAGSAFRAISEQTGFAELTEVRRQQHEWQREATKEFANGKTHEAIERYQKCSHVHEFETQAMAKKSLVEVWNDVRINDSDKTQIMLSYTRKDAGELNVMAREMRKELGELSEDHTLQTEKGAKAFAQNDRIYFLKNDRQLDVKNGSLGTIEKIEGNQLTVRLDREDAETSRATQKIMVDLKHYNHIDYGYAATIHKAQGVTVDRTYLLASKHMDTHATYVGMSRHRESADLFYSPEEFANERALSQSLSRERQKDVTLDYGELRRGFAEHRGIEVSEHVTKELKSNLPSERFKEQHSKPYTYKELGLSEKEFKEFNFDDASPSTIQKDNDDLTKFKQQYERENPEPAKSLSQEIRTEPEKRAMAVEKAFSQLEKRIERNPQDLAAKKEMTKLAAGISKDKSIMECIKGSSPELNERIQTLAKERERERSRDRGIER